MTKVFQEKLKVIPLSEIFKIRKEASLGHVIRPGIRDAKDPMYQVTFEDPTLTPQTTACRRVGRPRNKSDTDTMQEAWAGPNITQKMANQNTKEQNNKDLSSKQSQTIG